MAEFPKVFLSGSGEVDEIFKRLSPLLSARGVQGVRMPFPAQPIDAARASLKALSECQAMVILLQSKYGTPWIELGGKSITEHEFQEAFKRKLPLFCFIDNVAAREPALDAFVKELKVLTQKTLIYEESDLSNPDKAAERIAAATGTFRWVPRSFASFGEWENLLLAQYSRITNSSGPSTFPPPLGRAPDRNIFWAWLSEKDPKKSIAVVSGLPGFGKTLFAYHCLRARIEAGEVTYPDVHVILPGAELDLQSIREIRPNPNKSMGPVLLIVDDADERSDFVGLVKQLASSPHFVSGRIKLLLICQEKSVEFFYGNGYPLVSKTNSPEIRLGRLTLDDLKTYVKARALHVSEPILAAAFKVTNGIPLYLDLYFNHGYNLGTIITHEEMEDHFLHQRLNKVAAQSAPLNLLKGLALTGSISLTHPFFLEVAKAVGVPDDASLAIKTLIDQGLIYRVGTRHRVTDRLIQDFVLAKYWTVQPERDKIWPLLTKAGEIAPGILENIARAEWARTKAGATDKPFQDIWAAIGVAFTESEDASERVEILSLLKDAAYFLPELALNLAREVRSAHLKETLTVKELEAASDLAYAVGHWPAHYESAIDILWDLGKRDSRALNPFPSHGHRHLQELAKLKPGAQLERYRTLLTHIEQWFEEGVGGDAVAWIHSPIEVLDKLLDKEWQQEYYHRNVITWQQGEIPYSSLLEEIRLKAISLLGRCLTGEFGASVIGDALHKLRGQLPIYQHSGWDNLGKAALTEFTRTADHYLGARKPVIPYMIYQTLDDLAEIFDKDEKDRMDAASKALSAKLHLQLQSTFPVEYLVLNATTRYTRLGESTEDEFKKAQEALIALGPTNARILLEALRNDLKLLGAEPSIALLGPAKVSAWPDFGARLYRELITNSRDPWLVGHSIMMLWDIRHQAESDQSKRAEYLALLADFPETNPPTDNSQLGKALQGYLRWYIRGLLGSEKIRLFPEEIALVRGWSDATDITWSLIVKLLSERNTDFSKELILAARPGIVRKAADEVASALLNSPKVLSIFEPNDWKALLHNFIDVPSVDEYWLERLLALASNKHPRLTADYFLNRLKKYAALGNDTGDYRPLPLGRDHFGNAFVETSESMRNELLEEALALVVAADKGIDKYFLHGYANLVAGRFTQSGIDILLTKIRTQDAEQLKAVAGVIQYSYSNFVLDHPDIVEHLLNSASSISQEMFRSVAGCLAAGSGTRSYSRAPGEPSGVHVQLRDAAANLKRRFAPGSPTHQFYESIERGAAADIKREELDDEETLDE